MFKKAASLLSASTLTFNGFLAVALIAGELDPKQNEWHKKYKDQENAPQPAEMLLNTDAEPELTSGFTPLFNGSDLTGWSTKGGVSEFTMNDGVKTWVNGIPAAHWVDNGTYPKGFFGLQIHKGKEGTVLWRGVRVKDLTLSN